MMGHSSWRDLPDPQYEKSHENAAGCIGLRFGYEWMIPYQ
ncbi:hypothetical protein JOD43_001742 [Pullulanibacillus pueri]|nr:hypothetical protein [Pullulanibacillus pueri]